jgi:tetratricopeptide (TPR) repeat protein
LQLRPNCAEAHFNLAAALEEGGRKQEAIEHYQQAVRIRPDFVEAQAQLVRLQGRVQ